MIDFSALPKELHGLPKDLVISALIKMGLEMGWSVEKSIDVVLGFGTYAAALKEFPLLVK